MASLSTLSLISLSAMAGGKGDDGEDIIMYRNNLVIRGNGGGNLVLANDKQHDPIGELEGHHDFDHHDGDYFGHDHGHYGQFGQVLSTR